MSFVVSTIQRTLKPGTEDAPEWTVAFPVVFENPEKAFCTDAVAHRASREVAQRLADNLNKVLQA
jgi:hypothetical protein